MSVCGSWPVCKANCSVEIQWDLAEAGQVQADPDIVGMGVVVSFIVTANATFVIVILGYLTFSFADECMNVADNKIVERMRHNGRRLLSQIRRCWTKYDPEEVLTQEPSTKDQPEAEDSPIRKNRVERLRDFMLALTGQQLVTGLAILVAGFGRFRDITVSSASVVTALAYFSNSIHLGTLDFLETYLRAHRFLNICRTFAMTCMLLSLVFLFTLSISSSFWVQRDETDIFAICGLYHFSPGSLNLVIGRVLVILGLIWDYGIRMWTLYSRNDPLPQGQNFLVAGAFHNRRLDVFDYRTEASRESARKLIVKPRSFGRTFSTFRLVNSYAFQEVYASRASDIASLLFDNVYGGILIFRTRGQHTGIVGPFNTMGFGQIVPVFLLTSLLLALVESVNGYRDAKKEIERREAVEQESATDGKPVEGSNVESETGSALSPIEDTVTGSGTGIEDTHSDAGSSVSNPEESEDIHLQDLEHLRTCHGSRAAVTQNTHAMVDIRHESADARAFLTSSLHVDQPTGLSRAPLDRGGSEGQVVNVSPPQAYSSNCEESRPQNGAANPVYDTRTTSKPHSQQRGRDISSTPESKRISNIRTTVDDMLAASYYNQPTRSDTEALRVPAAEQLSNAIRHDPNVLLARMLREELVQIPTIYRAMLGHAALLFILQVLLACAVSDLFYLLGLLVIGGVMGLMFVLYWVDAWRWRQRILKLPTKPT